MYPHSLPQNLAGLENASVAISRIHEIATLTSESDPSDSETKSSTTLGSSAGEGSVVFQDIRLQYRCVANIRHIFLSLY
jgi:hypothetical protein